MTDPTKRKGKKRALPCEWVEQDGFEVSPDHPAKAAQPKRPDTAFLLRAKKNSGAPSPRSRGSH
jgi:hypothetical protein